jgi:pilus assembly protein CpaF
VDNFRAPLAKYDTLWPVSAEQRSVIERVRERIRSDQREVTRDDVRRLAVAEIRRHNDYALARGSRTIDDLDQAVQSVVASVSGYGPLQDLLDDPEEIWINGPEKIFVARGGVSERLDLTLTDGQVRDTVERMLHQSGRRIDVSQPFVDASLPDGSRLHVVLAGIARGAWSVNIRKFLPGFGSLDTLVDRGSLPRAEADRLTRAVRDGSSILVSGATHAGKTTLLSALVSESLPSQRIVTVEETFELSIDATDIVAMQGRQPSLEGTGEITLRRLVKEALRMRPDRLVIGEVRDAEALDLVLALNTGLPGAATIHANSAEDALVKLSALPLLAGRNIGRDFVLPAVMRSLDLVVHCARRPDGHRYVAEIAEPTGRAIEGIPETRTLYSASHADPLPLRRSERAA